MPKKEILKKTIGFRISENEHRRILQLLGNTGITKSDVLRFLLQRHVQSKNEVSQIKTISK
jgi:antitoxin component of RelBE/YafQ-DinJ toxin-antitoxin module